jgi:tRNA/tmRNA/rRNA uracil-C5-methylase (TrmA/RlmC/RlmD family)
LNGVTNIEPILSDARSSWADKDIDSVAVVDPPRTGLMAQGVSEILKLSPKLLVYISCNPITQCADLELLKEQYKVVSAKGFDMFPQTLHLENVLVLLSKDL